MHATTKVPHGTYQHVGPQVLLCAQHALRRRLGRHLVRVRVRVRARARVRVRARARARARLKARVGLTALLDGALTSTR